MKKRLVVLCAVLMVMTIVVPAFGDPIVVGNPNWYEFAWTGTNTDAIGGGQGSSGNNSEAAPGNPWTFTIGALGGLLTVTDAFLIGDAFNVYNFGGLLANTPAVNNTGADSGTTDPAVALTISELSHGVFNLAAGNYSLTIQAYQLATGNNGGAAYFRVDPVPVPPTVFLLGSGLLGLVGFRFRRKLS